MSFTSRYLLALGGASSLAGMAGFSHINLLNLEDTVAGRVDGIEGRFGRRQLASRDLGVSLWRYAPGFKAAGRGWARPCVRSARGPLAVSLECRLYWPV